MKRLYVGRKIIDYGDKLDFHRVHTTVANELNVLNKGTKISLANYQLFFASLQQKPKRMDETGHRHAMCPC